MKQTKFAVAAACALAVAATSHGAMVVGVDVADSQITPNHSTGSSKAIPLYAFVKPDPPPFQFNAHYSQMPIKWTLDLPDDLEGTNYQVTSASVTVYQQAGEAFWNPADGQIKLFKTAFSGGSGETSGTWTEAEGYYGPGAATPTPLQDPYLSELGTGNHAEDNLSATPWAVGQVDSSYNGSSNPTDAVPIRFVFDTNNPEIRQYLKDGLNTGYIMFTMASTFAASMPGSGGSTPVDYPKIVTKEGLSDASLGASRKAPTLTIDVSGPAAASNWQLY